MFDAIDEAAERFEGAVRELTASGSAEPSRLPGWSRRHVIAHVALNAEGFITAVERHRAGAAAYMYPDGARARDREIGELAAASLPQLLGRLVDANERFRTTWLSNADEVDDFVCATAPGHPPFGSATMPRRRLRELQVHLIDLGLPGVGPECWVESFVVADLEMQWATVEHRTSAPVRVVDELGGFWQANTETSTIRVDRRRLLAWVLDRESIAGLPQLEPWTNRSKWEHLDAT